MFFSCTFSGDNCTLRVKERKEFKLFLNEEVKMGL
ncbi:MAG: hypothetical protein QG646_4521 [Euryarchaeota archaeon]|nr:hypothetical protein [Euryarchaeota archaeon]